MSYDDEIKNLLGVIIYDKLLDAVDCGRILKDDALTIARKLGPRVGGQFIHSTKEYGRRAFRDILSNWFCNSACELSQQAAVAKLLEVLRDPDLDLNSLALEIENAGMHSPQNSSQTRTDALPWRDAEVVVPTPEPTETITSKPLEVKVTKLSSYPSHSDAYKMSAHPRGQVLIINIESFQENVLSTRTGSQMDVDNLQELFTQMGFTVTTCQNLGYADMYHQVLNFAAKKEHSAGDASIVAIFSHGQHGTVSTADGRKIETEWILQQFNNANCPALRGKPKIFLFQACRGDEVDYGVYTEVPEGCRAGQERSRTMSDSAKPDKGLTVEDMLIAYSAIPGYVSHRDTERGTWFVECLCKVFMEQAATAHLKDMLDETARRMGDYQSEMGAMQSFEYSVRHFYKKLFFNP